MIGIAYIILFEFGAQIENIKLKFRLSDVTIWAHVIARNLIKKLIIYSY